MSSTNRSSNSDKQALGSAEKKVAHGTSSPIYVDDGVGEVEEANEFGETKVLR